MQKSKLGPKIKKLNIFLKFTLLVFLDIAQDCSLGKCLTSLRAETSKTKKQKQKYYPNNFKFCAVMTNYNYVKLYF